jgi:acetolactate synthase-1/2/3 large subunit
MKVSDYIVSKLVHIGVTHVFTLQGGYSMYLNDAIGHSELKPVYMLTESGAAFAASGWAQYSGKLGVCVVTSGLAQTNALSGVASAYSDHFPMLVISGDIKSELIAKRDMGGLRQGGQQDVPITRIAQSITKSVLILHSAASLKQYIEGLIEDAMTEPRGPVWLDVPIDVQQEEMPNEYL